MSAFVRSYFRTIAPIAHYLGASMAVLAALWASFHPASYSTGRWVLLPVLAVLVMSVPLRLFVNVESPMTEAD
jgi:hypothetical protein